MTTASKSPNLITRNREHGFYGTMKLALGDDKRAADAFDRAMTKLTAIMLKQNAARDYLDSRGGRHLADYILGGFADSWPSTADADGENRKYDDSAEMHFPKWITKDIARFICNEYDQAEFDAAALEAGYLNK